ncbi:uncharacterized protein TEOVI_000664600 [Trypanosoma equiperdum]|uniref:T. brucei spp.-specific protein n=3 Tax=Trypanozoon TaxID=39700 RepID=C9ZUX2_TRYB9|nr:T. brucei spp.-specific protein [Trypanosoma brucei gambiense DAL972]RHW71128.1 hypothetical protein DPX39_080019900 [Trypanosoma brucei equiperdum]CBH13210.1 T. brucei spp.-specific protein [Trypanosoma brucei gambiense DAL972]SCU68463.1 hypothetical protein, conserved [Trypanosoma equiperdum]|eukprot:XP_011775487.1 T. brucei spp.-specific protein [Trypanosoma brucei gambiense DAL972]
MFSLREILSQLPSDGATKWIRVENVKSPMSSLDVSQLFPDAVSWDFLSSVQRTDYLVTFRSESFARKAMRSACGFSYLGERLKFSYAEPGDIAEGASPARVTIAHPRLYLLPPEFSYEERVAEADRIIASVSTTDSYNNAWVDTY